MFNFCFILFIYYCCSSPDFIEGIMKLGESFTAICNNSRQRILKGQVLNKSSTSNLL